MQLCQIEQNGHIIRRDSIRHPSSNKHHIMNTYLTNSIPAGNGKVTATNPYGITPANTNNFTRSIKDRSLSRSFHQKQQNTPDFDIFVKQIKQKIFRMDKTLAQHSSKINYLQDKKLGNPGSKQVITESLRTSQRSSISEHINRPFQDRIMLEIERLRQQINIPSKNISSFESAKTIFSVQQTITSVQSHLMSKVKQLKQKTYQQFKSINDSFRKQLQYQIQNTHDINRSVFNKIQKDVLELQRRIEVVNQANTTKQKSGKQKYLGQLHIIKFKEIVQKQNKKGFSSEQIIVSQGVYYLDKDGYLLDKQGYYLVDDDNKWVQLNSKQIKILRAYSILQQ